ncbi:uncharacterized protein TNCV_3001511 [Trichonephila clavipes]|nr:uncharacterized protein TNCV_3001511 [Trichonephila clavipes]
MNLNILAFVFKNEVHCKMCNSGLDMQVLKGKSGLAITFVLKCFACPYRVGFSSSNFHEGTQIATINTRFVYAMRSIGKGAEAGRMFCGVMNLPQPPTRFAPYGKRILNAAKLVYEDSIQNAAKEAICENEGNKNIAVAVDGTWQKRGYTSLNGAVTVTSIDTGKVIDVDILSKYCACKNLPFHEKDCKRNYVGSSGAMEIQGASKIFQRSLSLHNARYITYLGDGDCKAFDAVKKKNIYGNEYPIEKLECIGHVMKRMGTRLRRLKAQLKGQILSDDRLKPCFSDNSSESDIESSFGEDTPNKPAEMPEKKIIFAPLPLHNSTRVTRGGRQVHLPDREVEDNLKIELLKWLEESISLKILSVSCCFSPVISGQYNLSIHTFCDASQFAYAAAVFVRIEYSGVAHVNLLAAKSRIYPVKTVTIPRLELLAATVGARLCRSVLSALQWDNVKQHYWTDSTTALSWIQ